MNAHAWPGRQEWVRRPDEWKWKRAQVDERVIKTDRTEWSELNGLFENVRETDTVDAQVQAFVPDPA
jgi:hypothetical protein